MKDTKIHKLMDLTYRGSMYILLYGGVNFCIDDEIIHTSDNDEDMHRFLDYIFDTDDIFDIELTQ